MAKKARQRATSTYNFLNKQVERLEWEGKWQQTFGNPPKKGIWYIGGHSGSGKTSFVVQLVKALTDLGMRVRFYNFEEGDESTSLQETCRREGIYEAGSKVQWVHEFIAYDEIKSELESLRINAAVIDSRKEVGMTAKQVLELKRGCPDMLIIIICHVLPNGMPESAADRQVKQAARMKITVDRYRALNEGRTFGEIDYYNVWKEKADKMWAENI
ncbi:MAG: hypothetical protein ACK5KN_17660 [Dysgonomonas sp.]|uniref:hypothetical protein n=1 Tax=Dysgonomonas sp. TaxID=1891233 RepID=UPI003A8AEB54